ncbi:Branched-chain-amino-acid aminotransferase [Symmachiella macrocystis]|uniref:Branched-chain-amino-acid aminotransferase n=2 Tax=Symmachiella macrocystis TaxID=2527985 RepID=A0A5C6BRX4_9PLAN|nr:Branched-chain-amino-acid aminotransferase [Symmachiella macrocystis]
MIGTGLSVYVDYGAMTNQVACRFVSTSSNSFPPLLICGTEMSLKVYIAGELVDKADAKVSVFDHGFLYGDGVFEGIRVYNGRVFLMDEHIERLYESALAIRLEIPLSPAEMAEAVNKTVAANGITEGYVRLVISRGAGTLGLDIRRTSDPQVIIIADTISLYPPEMYRDGLKVITASTIRNHAGALSPRIKSLNYLNNILAKIEATDTGCIEALMLNAQGEVAECTGDNIFIVKDGILKTPPPEAGILEGITRGAVMGLARQAGLTVREVAMVRHDIYIADECFLTGTAAEVIPVVDLDGRKIGAGTPGPVTNDLLERFQTLKTGG